MGQILSKIDSQKLEFRIGSIENKNYHFGHEGNA